MVIEEPNVSLVTVVKAKKNKKKLKSETQSSVKSAI